MVPAVIIALFGAVFLALGVSTHRRVAPVKNGVTVAGTIVELLEVRPKDPHPSWKPIVEFVDEAGARQRVTSAIGTKNRPTEGTPVRISYPSGDPSSAHIVDQPGTKTSQIVLFSVGAGLVALAVVVGYVLAR
jgi:hypothetical protein